MVARGEPVADTDHEMESISSFILSYFGILYKGKKGLDSGCIFWYNVKIK